MILPLLLVGALQNTHALIWSSETSVAAAEQKRAEAERSLVAGGLVFGRGFPRVVRSDDVAGLKPGYDVVLLGYCEKVEPALSLAKAVGKQTYARDVTLHEKQLADASCPTPKPLPMLLIYRTGKNRVALEQGSYRVIALKDVPVKGKRLFSESDTHAAVLGVCPADRAKITRDATQSSALLQPVADTTPLDCPKLAGSQASYALEAILREGNERWASELLASDPALADRVSLLAAEFGRPQLLAQALNLNPTLTPAHMAGALASDNAEVVRMIGRAGVPVDAKSCTAFANGSAARAKAMVELGFKPGACGDSLYSLLQDEERFQLATKNGLQANSGEVARAMVDAVRAENAPTVKRLRELGFDETQPSLAALIDDAGVKMLTGDMPGLSAVLDNRVAAIATLSAADVERSLGGVTPLLLALKKGHPELALALLLRGAKMVPGAVNAGAALGNADLMRKLLARTPDPAAALKETLVVDGRALLPLHRAALNGDVMVVRALLDAGAPVDAKDEKGGLTALMLAAEHGKLEVALALETKRADIAAVDTAGQTAFDHALMHAESKPLIERWLKKKRDLATHPGTLGIAGLYADEDTIHTLIGRGAGRNGEGRKAANRVCREGKDDREWAFDLLREKYGADAKGWEGDTASYCRTSGC